MLRNSASCFVGLITIETLPADDCAAAAPAADHDATLAQFLAHLANIPATADACGVAKLAELAAAARRIDGRRTGGRSSRVRVQHSRVAADLGSLLTELTRALGLARRRIARSQ